MSTYSSLVSRLLPLVREIFPWDLAEWRDEGRNVLIVDVREPSEFDAVHIEGSISVARGILEPASEYGYEETVPALVEARHGEVVLVCRSGNRSVLAAHTLQLLGFESVYSLKTGIRGWNDYELPLVDGRGGILSTEHADAYFTPSLRPRQLSRMPQPAGAGR